MYHAAAFQRELENILAYWTRRAVDEENGGFYGRLDGHDAVVADAPKGAVLNARILWTFSAAYNHFHYPAYRALAERAFHYVRQYFIDHECGGVYWSVDAQGRPLDTKKQVYALAFTIYGLSEYYRASGDAAALELAKAQYRAIEAHSFDTARGGYLEAFARDWQPLADLRLSAKDANEKKTMNTHLHVLEAYANLYRAWPDAGLAGQIRGLLRVFDAHIIDPDTHHLRLFFDEDWQSKSDIVSYGHDIEAAWLLLEAAEVLGDHSLVARFQHLALPMATAAAEGLDADGGLNYELEPGHLIRDKHWWVQAEALVGFLNAYQLSGDQKFMDKFEGVWAFTQAHILDPVGGEWVWGVAADHSLMPGQDKAGLWKCPYHNGRACLEILRRSA
ncbi:AGE family epimerase/isomerase [Hymenobacter caeli]|uniref:Cellobiose 2-epimerase n=1 Tax=Hymenobacter caeli TaxID=2735894 RepID=A0ABX2FQI4_9BACT|nr:AGE family epimerase/isomerase [Hymenobacter caeli]NRT19433.1 mannobiose 2-epimerase [Hymenobacter caeli]